MLDELPSFDERSELDALHDILSAEGVEVELPPIDDKTVAAYARVVERANLSLADKPTDKRFRSLHRTTTGKYEGPVRWVLVSDAQWQALEAKGARLDIELRSAKWLAASLLLILTALGFAVGAMMTESPVLLAPALGAFIAQVYARRRFRFIVNGPTGKPER